MNNINSNSPTNLVETAANEGSFAIFSKALVASGLNETLRGKGPYTIFAPTDVAFEKLPAGKLDRLMKPENKSELASIINYHVSPGRVSADDIKKLSETKTLQGQSAQIRMIDNKVTIDGSNVTLTDITSSNGFIHAIDTVLTPTKH
jgi:uncharacterized surface protein with fasciclin (FAS1) repeats